MLDVVLVSPNHLRFIDEAKPPDPASNDGSNVPHVGATDHVESSDMEEASDQEDGSDQPSREILDTWWTFSLKLYLF
ncbi:fatty acid desaturase [Sesbania bispinosa]|nr:fatty acid desaturase [Sesbania bispinosa]